MDFKKGGQLVAADGMIYVPASADYYPPGVTIDKPVADETIVAGKRIALNATLTPGNGPFTYEWSSSSQGVLGTAEDINVMLAQQGEGRRSARTGHVVPQGDRRQRATADGAG